MLEFRNVTFQYDIEDFNIIDDLSFYIEKGEFVSVIGPSGCGKSTIFRLTNQLLDRKSGDILVDGESIDGRRGYCGYMPQRDLLFPWRTVNENLRLPMEIRGGIPRAEMDRRTAETLEHVGLAGWGDKRPEELSGGMRQRAAFARTLLTGSELLLLDEPFSALDFLTRITMQEWLLDQWEHDHKTVLFITHDVEEAIFLSGRVLVVYDAAAGADAPAKAAQLIARVPGVARVSCGFASERNMDDICEAAHQALGEAGDFCTWKVVGRRNHTDFPIDSMQINQIVGEHLCGLFPDKKVKMKGADVEVHVEVVQGMAYVYAQTMRGVGGLPVGTAGKVVCLLSSGIDSPVAMWRMARRGATCIAVHFSGRPQTASTSEYLSDDICRVLEEFGGVARMYVVPFGDYQREIAMRVPPALRIVIYRRFMMRVAERIARREGAKALVTGESLGQVASQTLDNLAATSDSVKMQIFRPLIGCDKLEIIEDAKKRAAEAAK